MEFTVKRERLAKILSTITHQILVKPALPILANILLETDKNNLKISATNLELGAVFTVEAQKTKTGAVTLPAKTLTELITTLTTQEVSFKQSGPEMEVLSGQVLVKLPTIPADEYPAIPKISQTATEVEGGKLAATLERSTFAAAVDSSRPILTGVLVEFGKNNLRFVSTDGYRLSFEELKVAKVAEEGQVVVPAKTLSQLARVIQDIEGGVKILRDPTTNQIGFEAGKTRLVSRLTEGSFPDWQKIIPPTFKTTATIDKAELLQSVKAASVFAKEAGHVVKLAFSKNLEVRTQSAQGTITTAVAAKISGETLETAFNWRYLTEALLAIPGSTVEINLVESLSPAKFVPTKKDVNFYHIIMPVRV